MRRIDLLITDARTETDNLIFSDSTGIQDSEFLRWANSAQTRIYSLIQQTNPNLFTRETIISAVTNQEAYTIPSLTFLGSRVTMVEYSKTGLSRDYYLLKQGSIYERVNGSSGDPVFYIPQSGQLLIQPSPQSGGSFRVITQKELPRLDIRRASVSAVTLDTVNRTITSLTFDPTLNLDSTTIESENYITIVDKDGNIKMDAIPVTAVDTTTGLVTLSAGFVYDEGETISVGDWVCAGSYSSTHCELSNNVERYLVDFMIWKVEKRDSSTTSQEISQEIKDQEFEITTSYANPTDDVVRPAILDAQYLDHDEWYK